MPTNQNLNPFAPQILGLRKGLNCGVFIEMDCKHSQPVCIFNFK